MDVIAPIIGYVFLAVMGLAIISLAVSYIMKRRKNRKQIETDNQKEEDKK